MQLLNPLVDELVSVIVARTYYFAVASFYRFWHDLDDEEVFAHIEDWKERSASWKKRVKTHEA
ncbi:MAG: hypothetical protein AB1546_07900 [bacterium]